MKNLIAIITKNSHFYTTNLLLLLGCIFFLITLTRAEGFIILNNIHTIPLTLFFQNITFLGDGLPIISISLGILILFKKQRKLAILLLIAYITSGIFSQILKAIISSPRPSVYFEMHHFNYYLDTFANCRIGFRSFPSGHTASAFATATIISNYFMKKHLWFITFLYAILIGYSRVYLAHHFLIDVFTGAIIGIIFGTLTPLWYARILKLKVWKTTLFQNNFLQLINNK